MNEADARLKNVKGMVVKLAGATWVVLLFAGAAALAHAPEPSEVPELRAQIRMPSRNVSIGEPVWVEFAIQNVSDRPLRLAVPGTSVEPAQAVSGLPLSHVFSGKAFAGLSVEGEGGQTWDVATDYHPPAGAPELILAPHASVGTRVDVTQYYPALRIAGRYRLQWAPYGGFLRSNVLCVEIAPLKQAIVQTDHGDLTIRFLYEDAPETVASFIELARSGFYSGLTFHRIEPGYLIQGGDPNGDGTGIRPDGRKLVAEFSDRPQQRGSVSMARLESDPDSASCQFFICYTRVPDWDGRYTIFGELVGDDSFETLDKLMAAPLTESGRPKRSLFIRGIRIASVQEVRRPAPRPAVNEERPPS